MSKSIESDKIYKKSTSKFRFLLQSLYSALVLPPFEKPEGVLMSIWCIFDAYPMLIVKNSWNFRPFNSHISHFLQLLRIKRRHFSVETRWMELITRRSWVQIPPPQPENRPFPQGNGLFYHFLSQILRSVFSRKIFDHSSTHRQNKPRPPRWPLGGRGFNAYPTCFSRSFSAAISAFIWVIISARSFSHSSSLWA